MTLAEPLLTIVQIFRQFSIPLLVVIPVAVAQELDPIDEIVVSATRMETELADVGRSISVVSKERIQNATQLIGLDEVLSGKIEAISGATILGDGQVALIVDVPGLMKLARAGRTAAA